MIKLSKQIFFYLRHLEVRQKNYNLLNTQQIISTEKGFASFLKKEHFFFCHIFEMIKLRERSILISL